MQSDHPEFYEWIVAQFDTFDKALSEAGILDESGNDLEVGGSAEEKFLAAVEHVLKEDFGGERSKYGEALMLASQKHPELAKAYDSTMVAKAKAEE
jgi:hypothetical protein